MVKHRSSNFDPTEGIFIQLVEGTSLQSPTEGTSIQLIKGDLFELYFGLSLWYFGLLI